MNNDNSEYTENTLDKDLTPVKPPRERKRFPTSSPAESKPSKKSNMAEGEDSTCSTTDGQYKHMISLIKEIKEDNKL